MDLPNPYRALFVANPQPMWVYDVETLRFFDVNEAALTKYGYARDEFLALGLTDIRPDEDADLVRAAVRDHSGATLRTSGPWRHRLRGGHEIEVEITSQLLTFAGRPAALVAVRDVSVERALEERVRHYSLHDALTGLGNRRKLLLQLDSAVHSEESPERALLVMDIDGLQRVNVELGRDAGDELLITIADVFANTYDTQAEVYRIAGETFAFVVGPDVPAARGHAQRLLAALNGPFTVGGQEAFVSAHIGIALAESGWGPDDLVRAADAALQSLQGTHGARVAVFNADHAVLSQVLRSQGFSLESELRRAVRGDQFRVLYQPIVDLRRGQMSGVEALVRWDHPLRGMLTPNEFIAEAERVGIVAAIDAWVLSTSCGQLRAWREAGLRPLRMSVNFSGCDLDGGPELVRRIGFELERNGLHPSLLEIELTESTALRNQEEVKTLLDDLRSMGVGVALDDFGTGYSMLDRIRDLQVDRIKIDRTFVRRAVGDGAPLVTALITMAHSLHLGVVAEGVETQRQLDMLRDNGCDFAQGYLIGRPMSEEAIEAQLRGITLGQRPLGHSRVARAAPKHS